MGIHSASVVASAAAFVCLLGAPGAGQWLNYPTPGIPRLPDGKPNLAAPAPRTAAGTPELSGLWRVELSALVNGLAWNVAQDLKPEDIQPRARSLYRERLLNFGKDSPMSRCLPPGLPALNSFPAVFSRIVQTPALMVIMYGGGGTNDVSRTIFTDGRGLPEDPNPTWLGYSIGRWDGDTLVVNTSGFNDRGWLDFHGHPQTDSLRIAERFRRRDFGHLEYQMTIDDPNVFTRPLSLRMDKVLAADSDMIETICENEKDVRHLVGGNGFRMSAEDLSKHAGTYRFASGLQATVTPADAHLVLQQGANGPKRALVPQSETLFVFRDNGDGVEFVRDTRGTVTHFVTHVGGNERKAVRLDRN